MRSDPDELTASQTEVSSLPAVRKKNGFERSMVNIGVLVTHLSVNAVRGSYRAVRYTFRKIRKGIRPLFSRIGKSLRLVLRKAGVRIVDSAERFSAFNKKFAERKANAGFGKAVHMQLSDVVTAIKNSGKFASTVVNHLVPVLSIAFLVTVVADKTSADYGVTVEYNGHEIGVVSEESVIDEAQQAVADRPEFYDTGSETYITATLSLKPLGAQDKVIDEYMLAEAIREQIEVNAPADAAADADEPLNVYDVSENDETAAEEETEKVRAFPVTVDGEFVGAVENYDEIEEYLDSVKEEYEDEDVIEVSFDKDIEYSYENYVEPDEIVDQEEIIDLFDSIVSEPVYYEVELGDSPWSIAHDNGITLDELYECPITFEGEPIEDFSKFCPVGAKVELSEEVPYLGIMTKKEITYEETIDYETVWNEDEDMYKGESVVDVEGVEGEKTVTADVTYKNGHAVLTEVVDETVVSEPVTKQVRIGTRETRTPVSTGSGGSGTYFWPVDGGYISAYQGDGRGHKGIDIAAPYGTPIYAAESGTVTRAGNKGDGYGNCVMIEHSDGNVTLYGHQSSIAIEYGDYVVKGQLIGYVGSTGDSTGNHLHFEVRSNGTYPNPLDYVSQY